MKEATLKQLVAFARSHGYGAFIQGNFVVVSDKDGMIRTNSLKTLKDWMGY